MSKVEKLGLSRLDSGADPDDYDWVIEMPSAIESTLDRKAMEEAWLAFESLRERQQRVYEAILEMEKAMKELKP